MKVEEWEKGLKAYVAANEQAYNDIEFTSIVIDAVKKKIEEEKEKDKQDEVIQNGE